MAESTKAPQEQEQSPRRTLRYKYGYIERDHDIKEDLAHLGVLYAISLPIYYITQPETVSEEGSFRKYRRNFGQFVFDQDEPYWNWMVHPYSGSQLYLYFRANGYNPMNALGMTFLQSTLFELTTEIYTEPASLQDLYQTPIIGSALGYVLEKVSMELLNTDFFLAKALGHLLNPMTLFWFYEGKVQVYPQAFLKGRRTQILITIAI